MEFLYSSSFYVYLAFVIVMVGLIFKGKNAILGSAYVRIQRITDDIVAAEKLRMEAQEVLAKHEKNFMESMELAEKIVQDAREKSDMIAQQATKKAEDLIARAEMRSEQTIARAEAEAVQTLKTQAVDKAFRIVQDIVSQESQTTSVANAIQDIKKFK